MNLVQLDSSANFLIFLVETIPTLWQTVRDFVALHPSYVAKDNSAHFMVDKPNKGLDGKYNLCHVIFPFRVTLFLTTIVLVKL
jgi:Glycolipid 2-alpha-mannosyltransferase